MAPTRESWTPIRAFRLLDEIAEVGKPIIILTGGEPLLRDDIFDIAKHGDDKGTAHGDGPQRNPDHPGGGRTDGSLRHPANQRQHGRGH
jgi:hypothetical protein